MTTIPSIKIDVDPQSFRQVIREELETLFKQYLDHETFLTPNQIAKILKIHPTTVYRWVENGKLKPVASTGKIIRIAKSELDRLLSTDDKE